MSVSRRFAGLLQQQRAPLALAFVALIFCTAPTPGDIGGCGQKAAELDPVIFFESKEATDCRRCEECTVDSRACTSACQDPSSYPSAFPEQCVPLVHDGEVCLRKLQYASCADYASYMSDASPSVPTECNFCPERAP